MNPFQTPDEPEEPSELAEDIRMSLEDLADELEATTDDADADMAAAGLPSIGLNQVMNMVGPAVATKATNNREGALEALALVHLETRALLEKHEPDMDPVDHL